MKEGDDLHYLDNFLQAPAHRCAENKTFSDNGRTFHRLTLSPVQAQECTRM